jgi:hypothetical protein
MTDSCAASALRTRSPLCPVLSTGENSELRVGGYPRLHLAQDPMGSQRLITTPTARTKQTQKQLGLHHSALKVTGTCASCP